jgi:hypothetical protein
LLQNYFQLWDDEDHPVRHELGDILQSLWKFLGGFMERILCSFLSTKVSAPKISKLIVEISAYSQAIVEKAIENSHLDEMSWNFPMEQLVRSARSAYPPSEEISGYSLLSPDLFTKLESEIHAKTALARNDGRYVKLLALKELLMRKSEDAMRAINDKIGEIWHSTLPNLKELPKSNFADWKSPRLEIENLLKSRRFRFDWICLFSGMVGGFSDYGLRNVVEKDRRMKCFLDWNSNDRMSYLQIIGASDLHRQKFIDDISWKLALVDLPPKFNCWNVWRRLDFLAFMFQILAGKTPESPKVLVRNFWELYVASKTSSLYKDISASAKSDALVALVLLGEFSENVKTKQTNLFVFGKLRESSRQELGKNDVVMEMFFAKLKRLKSSLEDSILRASKVLPTVLNQVRKTNKRTIKVIDHLFFFIFLFLDR